MFIMTYLECPGFWDKRTAVDDSIILPKRRPVDSCSGVHSFLDEGQLTDVVVEIERAVRKKPFLGGYRHKNTGVEYHHASAQTMPKPRPPPSTERFCRDTQTVQQKHRVQQTTNPTSTQMTKIGVYVGNMEDKLVIPGAYTTADDFRANILNKVII